MADLAPHETLELHELISGNANEIKTLAGSIPNVKDVELKDFLNKYLNAKKNNLEVIQKLVDTINQKQ